MPRLSEDTPHQYLPMGFSIQVKRYFAPVIEPLDPLILLQNLAAWIVKRSSGVTVF
jgi:hypothetical protein